MYIIVKTWSFLYIIVKSWSFLYIIVKELEVSVYYS